MTHGKQDEYGHQEEAPTCKHPESDSFNSFLLLLVFGRYLEHPESDLDDSGTVAIVGKRATFSWLVCESFSFIKYDYRS